MSYSVPAAAQDIERTLSAVAARGVAAEVVGSKAHALARLRELIPPGASVMTGASLSLKEIGFEELLISKNHPWRNLKDEIAAEKDPARQTLLRRQGTMADYFLGSVHAVAQTGQLVIASMTGSQIAPYAFSARNVIWVVGAQKITANLDGAIRRVREYVLPHEDTRMRESSGGKMGSMIGKLMIFEQEVPFLGRKLTLLLVNEVVGD
jgi:L-lactate utilization protein LutC